MLICGDNLVLHRAAVDVFYIFLACLFIRISRNADFVVNDISHRQRVMITAADHLLGFAPRVSRQHGRQRPAATCRFHVPYGLGGELGMLVNFRGFTPVQSIAGFMEFFLFGPHASFVSGWQQLPERAAGQPVNFDRAAIAVAQLPASHVGRHRY